jgi:hypothetical protein
MLDIIRDKRRHPRGRDKAPTPAYSIRYVASYGHGVGRSCHALSLGANRPPDIALEPEPTLGFSVKSCGSLFAKVQKVLFFFLPHHIGLLCWFHADGAAISKPGSFSHRTGATNQDGESKRPAYPIGFW